jgi:hypothetical protein
MRAGARKGYRGNGKLNRISKTILYTSVSI